MQRREVHCSPGGVSGGDSGSGSGSGDVVAVVIIYDGNRSDSVVSRSPDPPLYF